MNFPSTSAFAAIGCVLLASCYPYDESRDRRRPPVNPPPRSVSSPEQQKVEEQRERLKEAEAALKKTEIAEGPPESRGGDGRTGAATTGGGNVTAKPPVEEKRSDFAFANKVPGKDGFVFSPYNNKIVDVREIPSGTLVQDPTYTGDGKGYFRVP